MRLIIPSWIIHSSEKQKNTPIYTIHCHPTLPKIATGGQGTLKSLIFDCKIKIWNSAPIKDENLEENSDTPKLLSTLALHNGAVLCVRWSNESGHLLASGSDDYKIVIWELSNQGPKAVFGDIQGAVNHETYRPMKVLMGHESDVADLAWSPNNSLLASAGFDSNIVIWDGKTFEKLHVLKGHEGFVKGLTWDPVGKYLASQSDDKSVKIWRTSDFALEQDISAPYSEAAAISFFRRLSWSPEGGCIATANGENSGLCTAPIINREKWSADTFLVGHQAPIEVARFSPLLFSMPPKSGDPNSQKTISAVCALGSQDNCVSIWYTSMAKSLAVTQNIFNYAILDMAWSNDGLTLYVSSYDGTVACLSFEESEFGTPLSQEETERVLSQYGYRKSKTMVLESPEQFRLEEEIKIQNIKNQNILNRPITTNTFVRPAPVTKSDGDKNIEKISEPIMAQTTSVTKDGKKRIQPIFLAGNSTPTDRPLNPIQVPNTSYSSLDIPVKIVGEKRKPMEDNLSSANKKQASMRPGEEKSMRSLQYVLPIWIDSKQPVNLGIPTIEDKCIKSIMIDEEKNHEVILEAINYSGNTSKINCRSGDSVIWEDKLPTEVIHLGGSHKFYAASTADGKLYIYSPAGRRLLPVIILDAAISLLECSGEHLLYITSVGRLWVINIAKNECIIQNVSIGNLLRQYVKDDGTKSIATIVSASLLEDGMPLLITSLHESFTFNQKLQTWVLTGDATSFKFREKIGILESLDKLHHEDENIISVSEIENYLCCALELKNPVEYRYWLKLYAQKLSDENAAEKIEELTHSLLGPTYLGHLTRDWNSLVLGVPKRELLKELIPIFGKNRSLQRLIQSIDGSLRAIQDSESIEKGIYRS